MTIEEALNQAEIISDDESWVRIEKYPYKSFYEDEEETFIDLEKREISDPSKNVSTLGENNSQLITFVMDRYADGVDLVDMLIQIQYKLQNGEEATAGPVNVYASDDKIKFGWAISNIQTQVAQTIQFIVYCTGRLADNESYLLKTKPMSYRIENTLGTGGYIEEPDEDWFLQFENTMNEKMNQVATLTNSAIDSAADAKESEQNAAQSASTASTLASQVQSNTAQAKASADAAKVSEQNAKKSEDAARVYAGNASAVANVQIGTSDTAGLLRGGDIHVDESGALKIITTTDSTTQPNSHSGRVLIVHIGGVSEQDSTAGNQLFDKNNITTGNILNDGSFGNSTSWGHQLISVNANEPYTISGSYGNSGGYFAYYDESKNVVSVIGSTGNMTVTVPDNVAYLGVSVILSTDADTLMVNAGTTALPYEQYTGGQPAPNPFYPMPIKNSKVKGVRTYGGENFYDGTLYGGYYSNANFELSLANVSVYKSVKLNLKKGTYTVLVAKKINLNRLIVDGKLIEDPAQNVNSYSFTTTQDGMVGFSFRDATSSTTVWDETTFIGVFKTSSYTFSQPIELYGMGDVKDVIMPKGIERKFGVAVLDGSEAWFKENNYFRFNSSAFKSNALAFCTHFIYTNAYNTVNSTSGTFYVGSGNIRFNISDLFNDVAGFKEWLAENPTTVIYESVEETTEALPIADQIGLNSLATYDGITYVEFIYDELEPTFKGKYGTSEVGGMTLESLLVARNNDLRITALEATNEEV